MSFIKSIRLKNLRSLKDTGDIEIKPITILVGKNSVGKSTFARTFPLIRQSCAEEKRAPILWYGKLVDFGDFKTSLNRSSVDRYIEFSFQVDTRIVVNRLFRFHRSIRNVETNDLIYLTLRLEENSNHTYASYLKISIFDQNFEMNITKDKKIESITINGICWDKQFFKENHINIRISQRDLLPIYHFYSIKDKNTLSILNSDDVFENILFNEIKQLCKNKSIKNETIFKIIRNIPIGSTKDIYNYLLNDTKLLSLQKVIRNISIDSEIIRKICSLFYISKLDEIIFYLDSGLSLYFGDTHYLEPLRASAQRYYRRQELAVDEIDSKGSNIAMFVDSLGEEELKSLKGMMAEHFGIEVEPKRDEGHIALTLRHINGDTLDKTNLADLGVGYSQILPFLIQLWAATNRKNISNKKRNPWGINRIGKCFVIEQPELHLHPAYQAKISDVINSVINHSSNNLSVILETHSPHLIYRFGELVEEKLLNPNDVQVLIFDEKDGYSEVQTAYFDEDGMLKNWPVGFFQP
ncbi:DUF3696 domain-containing protein [Acinetobacter pittii]|uniref:DUF3696 domain-containing protein n=1 Tax=Acinetobacter pittii TaxID=48296 RepID=UPI00197F9A07|nr:DUF3696 domain-containing protein [Acinetobacter pittii]MBN6540862.1 DUF3696 domain-containing protein [Acinetobacter pittii]